MAEQKLNRDDEARVIQIAGQLARNATVSRAALASQLGESYGTARDLYKTLGYIRVPVFTDYWNAYQRQDVARRIVDFPASESWRLAPAVAEGDDPEETPFEEDWAALAKSRKALHYLERVDRLSGVGEYGALLMGFGDGKPLSEPLDGEAELLYLRPYMQENAGIAAWEQDAKNERFGLPLIYNLKTTTTATVTEKTDRVLQVHHSRVLHVAEGLGEDDVFGTPRLRCVLNRLQDLALVSGGSAEMFWRGAFPGMSIGVDEKADAVTLDATELEAEIQAYVHDLQRYMRLEGLTVQQLQSQVADPRGVADVLLALIAAGTGIPKRKLMGSERGELASSQDEAAWDSVVDTRRRGHCEPWILRPFVDRMIETGNLREPQDEWQVKWPALHDPDQEEQAKTAKTWTEALKAYADSPGAEMTMPLEIYLKKVWDLPQDEIDAIVERVEEMRADEEAELEAERQAAAEQDELIEEEEEEETA